MTDFADGAIRTSIRAVFRSFDRAGLFAVLGMERVYGNATYAQS
jgi:hypothetical protein